MPIPRPAPCPDAIATDSQHFLLGEGDTKANWLRDWIKAMGKWAAEIDKGTNNL